MPRTLKAIPQVVVLLPNSTKIAGDMRRGILKYVHHNGPWSLRVVEGYQEQRVFCAQRSLRYSGIIGRPYFRDLIEPEPQGRTPQSLIDPDPSLLGRSLQEGRRSIVRCDSVAIGRMAAEYFLARKYRHYAFVGVGPTFGWSIARGTTFAATVAEHGLVCHSFGAISEEERLHSELVSGSLGAWLKALPKPVALFAATDRLASLIVDACADVGLAIPFEVAVLGVDNDEDLCENTNPTLSSILLDVEQASYEAAARLDGLMRGMTEEGAEALYRPLRIVARRSTETTQIADPLVVRGLEFIELNACTGIGVPDVVQHLRASRRLVEIRFRHELGASVLDEIQRIRFERACALLAETSQPISEIVQRCGFSSESHLGHLFRRRLGCTMRGYRLSHGGDYPSSPKPISLIGK